MHVLLVIASVFALVFLFIFPYFHIMPLFDDGLNISIFGSMTILLVHFVVQF